MDRLAEIVKQVVERYAAPSFNSQTFAALDDIRQVYTVLSVSDQPTPDRTVPVVAARIMNSKVVIEADNTNKPLVEALLQAGILRENIILAYEGETLNLSEQPQSAY